MGNGLVKDNSLITQDLEKSTRPTVSVVRCENYRDDKVAESLERLFSLLGGMGEFISRGDRVLLKPNFIAPVPREQAAQTDPAVILEVAKLVKDFGGKPFIGDSPAWGDVSECCKVLGMEDQLRKLSVPVKQLNKPRKYNIAGSKIGISSIALDADKIINLPKLKAHQQLMATIAVKNIYGCVNGKEKAFWHFAKGKSHNDFCQMLIEIYQLLSPVLTIVDAVVAMEGAGPIRGTARGLGFLVGGIDPISCEAVCCRLIDFPTAELPIIRKAEEIGWGCSDLGKIKIVGDKYEEYIYYDFQPADQMPLRFTFRQVCKSIFKQIFRLTKRAITGK